MDFVSELPLTPTKKDSIWVIVDQLTKSEHFFPVWTDYCLQKLAKLYISEIRSSLHFSILEEIARSSRFKIRLQYCVPSSDCGQSERVIQILEDMLRICVIDSQGSWEDFLPLAKFTYNNSFQPSIQMIKSNADRLKMVSDRQKSYADLKGRDIEYSMGDLVFLKLELPPELDCIHDVFHVSMLRWYRSDPSHVVSIEEIENEPAGLSGKGVDVLEALCSNPCASVDVIFARLSDRVSMGIEY
ncbi:uncharacterized protein LOC128035440 [Gossypium raimondii]|uniref:uncharacterized protein LOC128035440 n=1 Tax=Gossypium raimondii TaxID=29730 RepID=UPI00227A070D|nr:uncharacterized protein LOC128035440 [Gossypium raimondii]